MFSGTSVMTLAVMLIGIVATAGAFAVYLRIFGFVAL